MTTTPTPDLETLMDFIGKRYTFTNESYPDFELLSGDQQMHFIVRHSALHMMKSVGKLAAEAETADHGGTVDYANLKTATTKMLVNVLKLAEELDISAEELAANVPNVMASA